MFCHINHVAAALVIITDNNSDDNDHNDSNSSSSNNNNNYNKDNGVKNHLWFQQFLVHQDPAE